MAKDLVRTLLLVDDEPAQARLVTAIAGRAGWRTRRVSHAEASADRVACDAVLIDHWSPDGDVLALVASLHKSRPGLPILLVTAEGSVSVAVAAMRAGASDFLLKPIAPDRLLAALEAATPSHAAPIDGELRPLSGRIDEPLAFDRIVGSAPEFRAALAVAAKAARARVPVLIEGASGVGKEVVAQAIHAASPRAKKPLVVVNCGAIPANLIESELFGHERGAFTGAFDRHVGRFQQADGGTLFLDEVGELPLEAQVKLLRAMQSGEIQPLGSGRATQVDVRVIAATNRTLAEEIEAGRFREDLFYRLAVVQLAIPPLAARTGDIPALARHLLARISRQPGMQPLNITDEALDLLMAYDWPGNVRQLQNALFRAAVLCEGGTLAIGDFPQLAAAIAGPARQGSSSAAAARGAGITLFLPNGHLRSLDEIEADVIRLAIGHYRGRMTEVARRLGIGRSTLYRKLGELGIDNAA